MKKIIVAIDGLKYSNSTVKHAIDFAKQAFAHVVGVFLDDITRHSYKMSELAALSNKELQVKMSDLDKTDAEKRAQAAALFSEACTEAHLSCSIHHDRNIALIELLHESIYADLLIISSGETFSNYDHSLPATFIKELLANVQCPVLLVPDGLKKIDGVVLLYDGKPSSVYAAKMFSYVFPLLNEFDTEVLFVNTESSTHLPNSRLMKEFVKLHIPNATYSVLNGQPGAEIVTYCKERAKNKLIVLGAYSRGTVSRWFQHSMADVLIPQLDNPLFIAHSK